MTSSSDFVPVVIGSLIAWLLWLWFSWFIVSKFGYRGRARWILFGVMSIPPVHEVLAIPFFGCFVFLLFWRWPVYQDLRETKKQLEVSQQQVSELQQQVGRNLDYIRKVNLEIQQMRQAIK